MDWREAEREFTDETIAETTMARMFHDAVERYGDDACQRYKGGIHDRSLVSAGVVPAAPDGEYAELTYAETGEVVRNLAAGLRELGVTAGDRVAIYSDTRMEWSHADMAIMSAGGVVSTVYTESATPQVRHLLDDPGATGVVVENRDLLENVEAVEDDLDLEFVVVLEDLDLDREDGYTLGEVHELGEVAYDPETFESWLDERDYGDLASLIYTSGTTGAPKGVQLTHENLRTNLNQIRTRLGPRPDKPDDAPTVDDDTVALSFLPLAHIMARMNHFLLYLSGATVGYAESPDTVGEDIQQVQPTYAASVPRVYERIYSTVREEASDSSVKQRLFEWSVAAAREYDAADDPGPLQTAKLQLADRLVLSKVREALGGEVEMFLSGGGSLSEDLARFYRAMGLTIVEAYGLTETAPVLTMSRPEDVRIGSMGPALDGVELAVDPDAVSAEARESTPGEVGELLAKGPNVFDGYWELPEKTEDAFTDDVDADGTWFRTGDVVARDDDGWYSFVDRVKNLIVLDTGKNVAPEPIEDEFATSARVEQLMVVGQDEKFIGALVVPNFEELRSWADERGVDLPDDPAAACEDDRVRAWVGEEIDRVNERLGHHQTIKEFRLVPEEWTPDNEMLTPSMKKKRRNIREAHEEELEDIYGREKTAAPA